MSIPLKPATVVIHKSDGTTQTLSAIGGGKTRIIYDGTVFKMNNTVLNFRDIYNLLEIHPAFVYLLYGDRAYLCSYMDKDNSIKQIWFESVLNSDNVTKTSSIYIESIDGIDITTVSKRDINSENVGNKVQVITDNVTNYPSAHAVKAYVDGAIAEQKDRVDALYDVMNGKLYRAVEDTAEGYTKAVPANAMHIASLDKIGGRTVVRNQLNDNLGTNSTNRGVTRVYNSDGTWTYNGTATAFDPKTFTSAPIDILSGHVYMFGSVVVSGSVEGDVAIRLFSGTSIVATRDIAIYIATENYTGVNLQSVFYTDTSAVDYRIRPFVIDLTKWFGADIAATITTAEDAYALGVPRAYIPYDAGTTVIADVESIVTASANGVVIASKDIPAAIRELDGYGETGAVVDFANKVYTAPDGTETDISNLLPDDFTDIEVASEGSITFKQSTLEISIPNQETYLINILGGET